MTRAYTAVTTIVALLACGMAAWAAPYCRVTPNTATLGNSQIRREWALQGGRWGTSGLSRGDGSERLVLSPTDEFVVKLYEGATIAGSECQWTAPVKSVGKSEVRLTFRATHPDSDLAVVVSYWLRGEEPWMRKSLAISGPPDLVVDEIEVERLQTSAAATRGGYGQPIFLDKAWYLGLEYPAGYNDVRPTTAERLLVLHHYPGRPIGDGLSSKTAVIGAAPRGLTRELAFSDYLDSIRIPTRSFLQYNSWYDLQGTELSPDNVLAAYRQFRQHLLEPYGLRMDAFVPDDGWQDPNSIWKPRADLYPEEFAPLARALEAEGSRLGLWMPLNGFNLNPEWGRQQGYEVSDRGRYYCLVGPKYHAEIRRVTEHRIREGNLAYYKHDFNQLQCTAPGHGHLPDQRHGHEASLDAEIGLLAWERQANPDIFLNVTSNVWLSPWWLMHADSIWMCASDFGYEKTFPQLSPREWDMSYRDAHFFQVYRQQGNLVPLSALMTHGIIHGRHCRLGGDRETLREFSDMVVLYYARGVQLKELYITPAMMDAARWQVLGEATRWAVDNAADLRYTVMVGGDPRQGEPYGYVHWNGDHGTVVLRNPAPWGQTIRVPFDQSVFYRGQPGREFAARIIYPYCDGTTIAWRSGEPHDWLVPACSVLLLEVRPGKAKGGAAVGPASDLVTDLGRRLEARADGSAVELSFRLAAETMARCDLYLIVTGPGQVDLTEVLINGARLDARTADGPGWRLRSFDLRDLAGQLVQVRASLPGVGERPFSPASARLQALLVADRPVTEPRDVARGRTPLPLGQGLRRASVKLLDAKLRRQATEHLTDTDLAGIQAGKLRFEIFDVNGEPQYADKWVLLNGERLARVPANKGELSAWQEVFLDLSPSQLARLKRDNTVVLTNAGGDCYKFRGVALSLQKADGRWVATPLDEGTYSSVGNWQYAEGEVFRGERSPEVRIRIP